MNKLFPVLVAIVLLVVGLENFDAVLAFTKTLGFGFQLVANAMFGISLSLCALTILGYFVQSINDNLGGPNRGSGVAFMICAIPADATSVKVVLLSCLIIMIVIIVILYHRLTYYAKLLDTLNVELKMIEECLSTDSSLQDQRIQSGRKLQLLAKKQVLTELMLRWQDVIRR